MELIRSIHIICAYTTGMGFLLRGILALMQSSLLHSASAKKLPHLIDTALLGSGLFMAISWSLSPTIHIWFGAKIIGLLAYIGFGLTLLRWGNSPEKRWLGLVGGILTYLFIVGAAHSKSALSFFAYL